MATVLNEQQILQSVYDPATNTLQVEAGLTVQDVQIGAVEIKDDTTNTHANVTATNVSDTANGLAVRPIVQKSANSGVTRVPTSTTVATLLAANANRHQAMIFNESAAVLYVKLGPTATSTDYTTQVAAGGYYEPPAPSWNGIITGILASGTGNVQATELS